MAPPGRLPHSRVGAFVRSGLDVTRPDIPYHFWAFFLEGWSPPPAEDGYCFGVWPLRTASRGRVWLASDDPLAPPRILLNGLSHKRNLHFDHRDPGARGRFRSLESF